MSNFKSIQLPVALLAGLYKDCLVDGAVASPIENTLPHTTPVSTAQETTQKNTVVVVAYPLEKLSAAHATLINAMLSACRLAENEVEIIPLSRPFPADLEKKITSFNAKKIMLFGLAPSDLRLPVNFPPFQIQAFDQRTYLFVPALEKVEQDKSLKIQLWKCLQQLYPA